MYSRNLSCEELGVFRGKEVVQPESGADGGHGGGAVDFQSFEGYPVAELFPNLFVQAGGDDGCKMVYGAAAENDPVQVQEYDDIGQHRGQTGADALDEGDCLWFPVFHVQNQLVIGFAVGHLKGFRGDEFGEAVVFPADAGPGFRG